MIPRLGLTLVLILLSFLSWFYVFGPGRVPLVLRLGSTTSTYDSGLLDYVLPLYEAETAVEVVVLAKGTGAAIRDGLAGQVDALLVHNRAREEELVAQGAALSRLPIMSNNFLIVGSKARAPYAHLSGLMRAMAAGQRGLFLSRGDESGTHAAEQRLWQSYGYTPETFGDWYTKTGTGMGQTLITANANAAATLVDSATWAQHGDVARLHIWYEDKAGAPSEVLENAYGYLTLNPAQIPGVRADLAEDFGQWLAGPKGQAAIAAYQIQGQQAFVPHSFVPQASVAHTPDAKTR